MSGGASLTLCAGKLHTIYPKSYIRVDGEGMDAFILGDTVKQCCPLQSSCLRTTLWLTKKNPLHTQMSYFGDVMIIG